MKKQILVPVAAALLVGFFALAAFIYDQQKAEETAQNANQNASLLIRDYSPVTGNPDAKVTIVEFFDPACATCKAFHPFVKQLMEANPGRIKLVMRYAPLHRGSDYVVAILEAARLQNKFWKTLDATYAAQSVWASHGDPQPQKLWMRLGRIGLDMKKAQSDMQSAAVIANIKQDVADGRQLGANKTPTFFVNGQPLVRFGYQQLQDLVASELEKAY